MTVVDWVIVAFTVVLAMYGYRQGFIVGVLSLAGFGLGAFLGARLGPLVLPAGARSPYAPLFALLGALVAGGVLAAGLEGLGLQARRVLRIPGLRQVDGLLGAGLTACIALGIAWIIGAVAVESTAAPTLRVDLQRSVILRALNGALPPSGPLLGALARFDPLPSVRGPGGPVAPPDPALLRQAAVRRARGSVVRVEGTACGLGIEGSGWVARPGIVVTNAHVVAGEADTSVQIGGRPPARPAEVIGFDAHDDVAVLRVPGLGLPPLGLGAARPGTSGAILGYPEDGPFDARPARLGDTAVVSTQDAYGNGPVQRRIVALRGLVRPGNSGGPVVDGAGRVIATVFAAVTGEIAPGAGAGGYGVPDATVRAHVRTALARGHRVGTGACAG